MGAIIWNRGIVPAPATVLIFVKQAPKANSENQNPGNHNPGNLAPKRPSLLPEVPKIPAGIFKP